MREYHKIHTVFKRDMGAPGHPLIEGDWSLPELELLASIDWDWTEKVDGTNVRVQWNGSERHFQGKTDNASLPAKLVSRLELRFQADRIAEVFGDGGDVCLYGEGYGAKIQKVGGNYRPDQDFVLFDVRVGDLWLRRDAVLDIGAKLDLDVVPLVGSGTLHQAIELVRGGFRSCWGDFEAEGVVARPRVELRDRRGHRIITKIKTRDFK